MVQRLSPALEVPTGARHHDLSGYYPGRLCVAHLLDSLPRDDPETAQDWIAPSGAHDQYEAREYMVWTDGNTYLCKQATVYTPEEYAQAWELYSE